MHVPMKPRRGSVLVEFALIALAFYLLLAVAIEMGRATFGGQTIQAAADLAAREIARTPLSVTYTSLYGTGGGDTTAALNDRAVRQNVYDERLLVIDLDKNTADPITIIASFPVVNQQLFPLMIFDNLSIPGRNLLRYPGALVTPGDESAVTAAPLPAGFTDSGLRVAVPLVTLSGGGTSVTETVTWVNVLEEINPGAFSVTTPPTGSTGGPQGMVGVRINYPFQAATLSRGYNPTTPFEPGTPVVASDAAVTQTNAPPGGASTAVGADPGPSPTQNNGLQPYGGEFGLGFQLAMGQRLRPFRSLLSGQAVYRREIFAP